MRKLLLMIAFAIPAIAFSQTPELSKDSMRFYRKQLQKMRFKTLDSLVNSEEYKAVSAKAYSQKVNRKFGVETYMAIGGQFNKFKNLNERLKSLNVKERPEAQVNFALGLAFRFNKIITGIEVDGAGGSKIGASAVQLYLSTNAIKFDKVILSPVVGIGSQSFNSDFTVQTPATGFNDYFTGTGGNKFSIQNTSPYLNFGLTLKTIDSKAGSVFPVLRVGYNYGLQNNRWKIEDGNSANAPKDRINGFYAQLIIGGGN